MGVEQPRFFEVNYNLPVPLDEIESDEVVWVVDFSFKPDIMKQIREVASEVVWIDHHVSAQSYGYDDLEGLRDFTEKGPAGCDLCWKYCFPDESPPDGVTFIGDYDAWRLEYEPVCYEVFEGLKMEDTSPTSPLWPKFFEDQDFLGKIIGQGEQAIRYRDNYCQGMIDTYGYETAIDKFPAYALNVTGFGSTAFGDRFDEYPVCIAYSHDGRNYTCSLYSKITDVSKIAEKFGGGGHKGAAGFVAEKLPFKRT